MIEQWIKQRASAAVAAGLGEWVNAPDTVLGKPIYRVADGSAMLVLSELGFAYDGPSAAFECRYDQAENLKLAPLREIMPKAGDLLSKNEKSRLLTISVMRSAALQRYEMQFSLRVYNQVASVLPRVIREWGVMKL